MAHLDDTTEAASIGSAVGQQQLAPAARDRLARELRAALGGDCILTDSADLVAYGFDASFLEAMPDIVALPRTPEQVALAARIATAAEAPVVARSSGTGLCGGAVPIRGGVVISTARLNHIRQIDAANRRAVVEPGVINLELSQAARPYGLYYAPDPASQ